MQLNSIPEQSSAIGELPKLYGLIKEVFPAEKRLQALFCSLNEIKGMKESNPYWLVVTLSYLFNVYLTI